MEIDDFSLSRGGAPSANTRAVKIPQYQQRTAPSGQINSRAANVQVTDAVGHAMGNAGRAVGGVADYMIEIERNRLKLEANAAYVADANTINEDFENRNRNIAEGGVGFSKEIDTVTKDFLEKATKDKPEFYRQEYEKNMGVHRANLLQKAREIEFTEGKRRELQVISNNVRDTVTLVQQDPSKENYDKHKERLFKQIDEHPALRIDAKEAAKENIEQQLLWARTVKAGEAAAKGAQAGAQSAVSAGGGFDAAVSRVLKHEGGYNAKDGNTGAPVNFGINQKHNPDVDVKSLTKEGAVKIYKEKYWNAIGGDNLPAALQGTALDAAVNQGPENAKKWIAESGGDVAKFNALRQAHYDKLAASGKYKASDVASWQNRMKGLGEAVSSGGSVAVKGMSLADIVGPDFYRLSFDNQQKAEAHFQTQFKQEQNSKIASLAIESAAAVVTAAPLEAGQMLDIPALKEQAVTQAETRLGQKLDAQQRLAVENNVEKQASDRERDFKRSQEKDVQSAFDYLDKNGGDYQALVRDNPAVIQRAGRDGAERLQKYAGEVAMGGTRATDWQAYSDLVNDPQVMKQTNLDALKDKFNAREFAQLKKIQQHLKTETQAEDNILGDKQLVGSMLKSANVTDDKKEAQFYSLLQQAIDQELAASGKKALTQDRKKELAADLLVTEITSKGTLWDSKEKAFLIQVPDPEKTKIIAALSEAGMPATEYNIIRAYRNKLNKKPVLNQPIKQPEKPSPLVQQIPQ